MPDQPSTRICRSLEPSPAGGDEQVRVVLANVVEVVGNRAPDVERRVVLEKLEELQDGRRINSRNIRIEYSAVNSCVSSYWARIEVSQCPTPYSATKNMCGA
jgi:hypothetical protein